MEVRHRIVFKYGPEGVYTRCPICGFFIGNDRRTKDEVGRALAKHANEKHLDTEEE